MDNEVRDEQELEIDLRALFYRIIALWRVVVIGVLAGTVVMTIYSTIIRTPMYESTSQIYLRGASNTVSLQDLQVGSQLTSDYEILFKSRPNMEKVIKTLELDYTVKELKDMISISNPNDTRILNVSVTAPDPNMAKDIANEVVERGMNNVREIDSQEPYLVEKAIANKDSVSRSTLMMALIGAIVGLIATVGGIFVQFVLSDKIQSVDDIEHGLGLPVLAVVPEQKALSYAKKNFVNKKQQK